MKSFWQCSNFIISITVVFCFMFNYLYNSSCFYCFKTILLSNNFRFMRNAKSRILLHVQVILNPDFIKLLNMFPSILRLPILEICGIHYSDVFTQFFPSVFFLKCVFVHEKMFSEFLFLSCLLISATKYSTTSNITFISQQTFL